MRKSILIAILFCSIGATAAKTQTKDLLEVTFERGSKTHRYTISSVIKNKKRNYVLSFINEKKKVRTHQLTSKQYEAIKNEATRIIWDNQFRKPASYENCKEYLSLKTADEKARICYQNVSTTGKSFGFLNSLNYFFQ